MNTNFVWPAILASALAFLGGDLQVAQAGTVTVITSFPKELTQIYKSSFEKANPDIKIEILNKNTVQGIAYVRELPAGQRPDVFWASDARCLRSFVRPQVARTYWRTGQQIRTCQGGVLPHQCP